MTQDDCNYLLKQAITSNITSEKTLLWIIANNNYKVNFNLINTNESKWWHSKTLLNKSQLSAFNNLFYKKIYMLHDMLCKTKGLNSKTLTFEQIKHLIEKEPGYTSNLACLLLIAKLNFCANFDSYSQKTTKNFLFFSCIVSDVYQEYILKLEKKYAKELSEQELIFSSVANKSSSQAPITTP